MYVCEQLGVLSPDELKRKLTYRQINDWIAYYCQKLGVSEKHQTQDQMLAAMQATVAVTKAINGSRSKS